MVFQINPIVNSGYGPPACDDTEVAVDQRHCHQAAIQKVKNHSRRPCRRAPRVRTIQRARSITSRRHNVIIRLISCVNAATPRQDS